MGYNELQFTLTMIIFIFSNRITRDGAKELAKLLKKCPAIVSTRKKTTISSSLLHRSQKLVTGHLAGRSSVTQT